MSFFNFRVLGQFSLEFWHLLLFRPTPGVLRYSHKTYDISSLFWSPEGICSKCKRSISSSVRKELNWICKHSTSFVVRGFSKEICVEQLRLSQYSNGKPGESKFSGWTRLSIKLFGKQSQTEKIFKKCTYIKYFS